MNNEHPQENEEISGISFDKIRANIFSDVYIANVYNRLREITNPTDADCKRWIWELIQNAKDSIVGNKERTGVDVVVTIVGDTVTFKHNGEPFTDGTLFGLLYKYSKGKDKDNESTGRFGTGFLTTHALSKIVKISGDRITGNPKTITGFNVVLYREGEREELSKGLERMEKSFTTRPEPYGWTTYEYNASTKRNKEAKKFGLENFKQNIEQTMLFCPEINSVVVENNGRTMTTERAGEITIDNNFKKATFISSKIDKKVKRIFMYITQEKPNKELSMRFDQDRTLRLSCSIELNDKEDEIVVDELTPCLYCSLPLVGSEAHILPFVINSRDFEPDSERQGLLLKGDDFQPGSEILSCEGINRMILKESMSLYEDILNCVCNNNLKNRYYLARGLKTIPRMTRHFDGKRYMEEFIEPMREILIKYPIVWDGEQYRKLDEVYIPCGRGIKGEFKREIYDIISKFYSPVPTYEETLKLQEYLWNDDERIRYKSIKDCVKIIEKKETIDNLSEIIPDVWDWLDKFLVFVKENVPSYLEDYAIIPNMYGNFVNIKNGLAKYTSIPDNMIKCLEDLNTDWFDTHIDNRIVEFSTGINHGMDYAVSKIHFAISRWSENTLKFACYIPSEEDAFTEKRQKVYELCKHVWSERDLVKKDGTGIPEDLWNVFDSIVFEKIIKEVEQYNSVTTKYSAVWLNKLIECLNKYHTRPDSRKIFPNQNGKLHVLKDLYDESNIPDTFKRWAATYLGKDIKSELKDRNITSIESHKTKTMYDFASDIKKYFQASESPNSYSRYRNTYSLSSSYTSYASNEDKIRLAKILITIVPKDEDDKQRKLFDYYCLFTRKSETPYEINAVGTDLWNDANKYILELIGKTVSCYPTVSSLAKYILKSEKDTLEILKFLIENFGSECGAIVPNQLGKFSYLYNLYGESKDASKKIPDILKDISEALYKDVRATLIHESMDELAYNKLYKSDLCASIDSSVYRITDDSQKQKDTKIKTALRKLVLEYFKTLGDEEAEKLFPITWKSKGVIVMKILCPEGQLNQLMALFGDGDMGKWEELLKNPKLKEILEQLREDPSLFAKFLTSEASCINEPQKVNTEANEIVEMLNRSCTSRGYSSGSYRTAIQPMCKYYTDFDFDHRCSSNSSVDERTWISGMSGEAFIYEKLLSMKRFKTVKWMMLSESEYGTPFNYNGKTYYLDPDGAPYDIYVETYSGTRLYIEVKASSQEMSGKVPIFLSRNQINSMRHTTKPDAYILAVVFGVTSSPESFFMILNDNFALWD